MNCFEIPNRNCKHCLSTDCVKSQTFLQNLEFLNVIGSGGQGVVINAKYGDDIVAVKLEVLNAWPITLTIRENFKCNSFWMKIPGVPQLVAKYLKLKNNDIPDITMKDFKQECDLAKALGIANVGPKVFFHGICLKGLHTIEGILDIGILVMEKYDMSLEYFIQHNVIPNPKISLLCLKLIFKNLRALGPKGSKILMDCDDINENNIVLKFEENGKIKVRLIDFGYCRNSLNNKDRLSIEIEAALMYIKINLFHSIDLLNLDVSTLRNFQNL